MSAGGRSRAAALALLAGVVMVVGAAVVVPAALYWSKKGAVIRDARLKVMRAEDRVSSREALVQTQESWTAFAINPTSGFSLATTDEVALTETEERVKNVFATLNGSATSVAVEAADGGREGVRKIALEVRGSIPRGGLSALLGALESTSPFVVVQRFEAKSDSEDRLRISLSGTVYRMAEGAS